MKKIYQKLAYTIMITAFAWVVIGDLVNMHMKIIYKKDLCAHNTFFTKTIKDKSSYKISVKNINHNHSFSDFINSDDSTGYLIPFSNIFLSEKFHTSLVPQYYLSSNLRGPPSAS